MKRSTTTLGAQIRGRSERTTTALEAVSRALEPLTPEERARVVHAMAVFFGIDLQKVPAASAPEPHADADADEADDD